MDYRRILKALYESADFDRALRSIAHDRTWFGCAVRSTILYYRGDFEEAVASIQAARVGVLSASADRRDPEMHVYRSWLTRVIEAEIATFLGVPDPPRLMGVTAIKLATLEAAIGGPYLLLRRFADHLHARSLIFGGWFHDGKAILDKISEEDPRPDGKAKYEISRAAIPGEDTIECLERAGDYLARSSVVLPRANLGAVISVYMSQIGESERSDRWREFVLDLGIRHSEDALSRAEALVVSRPTTKALCY